MKVLGLDPAGAILCRPSGIAPHLLEVAEVVTQPNWPIMALAGPHRPSFEAEDRKGLMLARSTFLVASTSSQS